MIYPVTAFISPGSGELLVVMLAFILLFGAKDAPRMLRTIQAAFNKIQRASAEFRYNILRGDLHLSSPDESPKDEPATGPDDPANDTHEKPVS